MNAAAARQETSCCSRTCWHLRAPRNPVRARAALVLAGSSILVGAALAGPAAAAGGGTGGGGTGGGGTVLPAAASCVAGVDVATGTSQLSRDGWFFTLSVLGANAEGVWHVVGLQNGALVNELTLDTRGVGGGWAFQSRQALPGAPGTKALTWSLTATNAVTGETCSASATVKGKF
jgi:hypothetical protein